MGVTSCVYRELATQSVLFSQSTHFTSPTLCLVCQRWTLDKQHYLPDVLLCPTTLNVSAETFFTEIYVARGLIGLQAPLDRQLIKCLRFHCRPDVDQILREMGQQATKQGISRIAVLFQINGKGGHLHKYKDVAGNEAVF
ncbi:hypothetical protein GQ600_3428 [Phytophthora cactorum]|nr:hypothetical protein GQ600_3428 [Phytophthora cactorum]